MQSDLTRKARARRVLALARLARRRVGLAGSGRRALPKLGPDEIGNLFAVSSQRFDDAFV